MPALDQEESEQWTAHLIDSLPLTQAASTALQNALDIEPEPVPFSPPPTRLQLTQSLYRTASFNDVDSPGVATSEASTEHEDPEVGPANAFEQAAPDEAYWDMIEAMYVESNGDYVNNGPDGNYIDMSMVVDDEEADTEDGLDAEASQDLHPSVQQRSFDMLASNEHLGEANGNGAPQGEEAEVLTEADMTGPTYVARESPELGAAVHQVLESPGHLFPQVPGDDANNGPVGTGNVIYGQPLSRPYEYQSQPRRMSSDVPNGESSLPATPAWYTPGLRDILQHWYGTLSDVQSIMSDDCDLVATNVVLGATFSSLAHTPAWPLVEYVPPWPTLASFRTVLAPSLSEHNIPRRWVYFEFFHAPVADLAHGGSGGRAVPLEFVRRECVTTIAFPVDAITRTLTMTPQAPFYVPGPAPAGHEQPLRPSGAAMIQRLGLALARGRLPLVECPRNQIWRWAAWIRAVGEGYGAVVVDSFRHD